MAYDIMCIVGMNDIVIVKQHAWQTLLEWHLCRLTGYSFVQKMFFTEQLKVLIKWKQQNAFRNNYKIKQYELSIQDRRAAIKHC